MSLRSLILGTIPNSVPPPRQRWGRVGHRDPWLRFEAEAGVGPMTLGILDRVPTGRPVLPEAGAHGAALAGAGVGATASGLYGAQEYEQHQATRDQRALLRELRQELERIERQERDVSLRENGAEVGRWLAHAQLRSDMRDLDRWSDQRRTIGLERQPPAYWREE